MAIKHFAAAAALAAACAPVHAFDQFGNTGPSTLFYISIPLDSSLSRKESEIAYGIRLQGNREYQSVNLDSRMFRFLPLGGLEVKWLVAGALAVGTVAAMSSKNASTTSSLQAQQTQHAQQVAEEPCPEVCQ